MTVRGVVVDDQVKREALGRLAVDQAQELQLLRLAVPRLAHRDHPTVRRVQGREQRGPAVSFVVVRAGACTAGFHRQTGLRAVAMTSGALY